MLVDFIRPVARCRFPGRATVVSKDRTTTSHASSTPRRCGAASVIRRNSREPLLVFTRARSPAFSGPGSSAIDALHFLDSFIETSYRATADTTIRELIYDAEIVGRVALQVGFDNRDHADPFDRVENDWSTRSCKTCIANGVRCKRSVFRRFNEQRLCGDEESRDQRIRTAN